MSACIVCSIVRQCRPADYFEVVEGGAGATCWHYCR